MTHLKSITGMELFDVPYASLCILVEHIFKNVY
jgi:hypothetical protein